MGQQKQETLPALQTNMTRHVLMAGTKGDQVIKELREDIDLDDELGLPVQAQIDSIKALRHDIDTLTQSRDYMEVSVGILNKLFQIKKLQMMCVPYNLKEYVREIFKNFQWIALCLIGCGLSATIAVKMGIVLPWVPENLWFKAMSLVLGIISFGILALVLLISGFYVIGVRDEGRSLRAISLKLNLLRVELKECLIKDCHIPLPRGAKLKLKEAVDSGIFQNFKVLWPDYKFKQVTKEYVIRRANLDPAIVGITQDGRMYMIVSWDIESDIEKTAAKIKMLRKYKLPNKYKI